MSQRTDRAIAEMERCVKTLGLHGIETSTNVLGKDLTKAGLERCFALIR